MYHFQVDSMGVRFCVFFVILQTIITTSLGGVYSLPQSGFVGKVTPVKPKPLSPSTISSSGDLPTSKSSLLWDGEDILQALCSSSSLGSVSREFSSPLIVTSSPRFKPMIDASSILDIKLPNRIGKDTLSCIVKATVNPKCNASVVKNTFPPNVSPLSASYPLYYKSMYLPRVETPSEIKPLNYRPTIGDTNINIPSQSQNLLRPTSINSSPSNLSSVSGRTPCSPEKSSAYPSLGNPTSSYLNPVKTSPVSSNIPIPKIPLSIEPVLSAQKVQINNPRQSLQKSSCLSSVAFESKDQKPISCNPSLNIRSDKNLLPLSSSIQYTMADKILNSFLSDPTLTVLSPTSITVPKTSTLLIPPMSPALPSVSLSTPSLPLATISKPNFEVNSCNFDSSSPDFNMLKTCRNNIDAKTDYSRNDYDFLDTINNKNTHELIRKFQPRIDLSEVPCLKRIDIPERFLSPLIPEISSCYSPKIPEKCGPNMREISPLRIPSKPVTSILPGTSSSIFCPKTPQTTVVPTSYINVTPSYGFSQSSSDIVSSINNIVSNISQNILSSCISYIKSTPNNKVIRPQLPKSNPYANSEFNPKQTFPIRTPLPPVNVLKTESNLPILSSPISIDSLPVVVPAVLPIDEPITVISSSSETSYSQSSTSLFQPRSTTLLTPITHFLPQLCPSHLPSPTLPSYPIISSPLSMEPIVLKARSSKKNSKDINKLIELMLIAELLNDDESFDWDDLDILLAYLSMK